MCSELEEVYLLKNYNMSQLFGDRFYKKYNNITYARVF